MKIKILRDTKCNDEPVKKGDVVETNNADAKLLINIKKAVLYEAPTKKSRAKDS